MEAGQQRDEAPMLALTTTSNRSAESWLHNP
jgi:hypothetical protein